MSTKNCPFCAKEISDEAIICKFCHRLLIDENGKDIGNNAEAPAETAYEPAQTDDAEDQTRVFSKDELKRAMSDDSEEAYAEEEYYDEQPADTEYADDEQYYDDSEEYYDETEASDAPAPLSDEEFYQEFGMKRGSIASPDEYDPKRTFIITAIITFGILLVIVGAVMVGYKLFDFKDTKQETTTPPVGNSQAQNEAPTDSSAENPAPDDSTYIPSVIDDTISEDPEQIGNESIVDPVVDPSATSSSTDSDTSSNADASSADDSSDPNNIIPDDSSAAELPTGEGAPSFLPEGSYYSWGEAEQLMSEYAAANGLGEFSYYGGTDGVEMIYAVYDDMGNVTLYRIDLVTGFISQY